MKPLYQICFSLLLLSSCSNFAHRVAYGPNKVVTIPKTPSETVGEAVKVKQTVDQYSKEVKQQKREEKQDKYAAIQQKEQEQANYIEMRNNYLMLREQVDEIKKANSLAGQENAQLSRLISEANKEIEALKTTNKQLNASVSVLTDRIYNLEARPVITEPRKTSSVQLKEEQQPDEVVNLGDMAVVGGTSVRKAKNGTVSVHQGSTHSTYTPRSQQRYFTGPRGGCYYYTASGRKEYVSRSLCN